MRSVQSPNDQSPKGSSSANAIMKIGLRSFGLCILGLSILTACQTERVTTSDGWRMPPAPRSAPTPPASARADRMVFTVGSKPDDTNNNGFPDGIQVSVALFSSQHPTALRQDGTFAFTMYRQGEFGAAEAKPMYEWKLSKEQVLNGQTQTYVGPSYLFQVSLLDMGTDRLPLERADLVCRFEPSDGSAAVHSDGVRSIQIGRRMSADAR
jgi:hypothetical protein